MFGHQDNITTQDHKTDVNVQLPDDAIAALTHAADDSQDPIPVEPPTEATNRQHAPHKAAAPSIDGISRTPEIQEPVQLPSSYLEFLGAPGGALPPQPAPQPSAQQAVPVDEDFASEFPKAAVHQATQTTEEPLGDLQAIKRTALEELSPLVGQLEQTPEERFKTLMMLIQASDNQSLLAEAHEAARHISDEKLRAQALLEVVNEVNYFTRNQ